MYTVNTVDLMNILIDHVRFQGYGSIVCPLSLIRGKRSARVQQATIEEQRQELQTQIRELKNRVIKFFE